MKFIIQKKNFFNAKITKKISDFDLSKFNYDKNQYTTLKDLLY